MKSTFKRLAAIGLFSVLGGLSLVVASCGTSSCSGKGDGSTQGNGFFAAENGHYVLTDDYVVTAEDIEGMGGTDGVTLSSSCTFDLRGHTLDLNGYVLNFASDGAQVEIQDGTVANGRLNIAIPDGEVRFADATFTDSLSCEIGASGNAVTFEGVSMYGPCTVQSECSLNMTDSKVSDITLTEKAELVVGVRADIAQIRADSSARGAAVSITPGAEVGAIALESSAEVTAAGLVGDITVSGGAASSEELPKIDVLKSGAIDRLRLDSAAEVSIFGYISSLTLSEAADGGSASAITVGSEGNVTGLTLNAAARVDIEGHVSALTVGSSATDEPSELVLTIAEHSGISNASINSAVDMTLDSIVYRMMVAEGAEGSNLTFGQNAGMGYIAVLAEGVSISKVGNGNVYIYVAEGADTSLFADAITVYTSTQQNIEGLFAHEHAFTVSSRTAPTCTAEGVIEEECACGERQETKIAATGHSYEYSVVRQPSASQDGMGRYTCIYCGATQDVPIKPSASLTIDGLNALYGLIPDGVYTFRTIKDSPFTVVSGGNTLELQFVITVRIEDGNMSAECDGSAVNTYANGNVADIQFKAISDGSTVFIYQLNADDDTDMIAGDSISYYAIGAILNSIYPLQTNFDADELYNDYLSVFVNQDGTAADTLLSDLTEKLISSAFDAEENADGSRTYSLNAQALHAVLEETGDGSVAMALDGLFGDGTAADIEGYLDGIEYKKTSDIVGYALSVADKMGMGKQQLYAILGNALSEFSDTTIDFDALVLIYGDKPLAEAVRQYLIDYNGTSYDEEYVAFMISLLADNIGSLLNSKVSQVLTAENIPELPFDYAQLVAAVGKYGKDVGLTFTLDADDNLIAFDVTYMASVTGSDGITTTAEIFSASWKEGDAVPQISFDYDGAVASVEESEDGEITVSVSLMGTEHVAMLISKSQEGLQLSVTVNSADGGKRLVDLSAEYISDGEGGELAIGGTLDGATGGEVNIEGTVAVGKGDSSQSDTGASGEVSDLKDILYRADITLNKFSNPDNGTLRLEYATDERGEFYRVTDTAVTYYITDSFAMGGVTYYIGSAEKIEKILRVDCIDGLPDIICSCSDDCDGWVYLNIVAVGRAEIYRTRTEGVFIKQEDGSYVAVRKDSEDRLREDIFYPSSGNDTLSAFAYYNPVTGESSPSTAHKFSFSGRLQEGSTSCEDGAEVTATCTVCGYSYTYYKQGHEMTTVEEHSIATQCGADTKISVSRCSVCGYELISDNMTSPHVAYPKYPDIISSEQYVSEYDKYSSERYEQYYQSYLAQGYSAGEAKAAAEEEASAAATKYMDENFVDIGKIEELGADTDGFSYGTAWIRTCQVCGLTLSKYTYHANASGKVEDCHIFSVVAVRYDKSEGFEPVDLTVSASSHEHFFEMDTQNGADLQEAVEDVLQFVPELPFTAESCSVLNTRCKSCGFIAHKLIALSALSGTASFDIDYGEDGKAYCRKYSVSTSDISYISQFVGQEYAQYFTPLGTLSDAYLSINYSENEGITNDIVSLNLSDGDGNTVSINKSIADYGNGDVTGNMYVVQYLSAQSTQTTETYKYKDGAWVLSDKSE